MSTLAFACAALLLAADPAAQPRPFHEIDRDLTSALRRESVATDMIDRGGAVRELAALFTELDRDPRLLISPTLQEHRARARGRLVNVQKALLRNIARAEKDAMKGRRSPALAHAQTALLAASADVAQREVGAVLAAEVSLAGYASGGPAQVFQAASGAGGGGPVGDFGEELVDLITRTIFPDKWEVNGGDCTIVYYRPLMCLVVTATGTTHGGVEGLLGGLRAAGP